MSSYIKPQSPLYNEAADTYIYPLTTVDQIVLSNGERLNESCFGKGIELNYSIIGGLEEPENPTENMIWVQTDEEITKHRFSKDEPKNPIEGMVWVFTGDNSNVSFHTLNINEKEFDEIYPISAKQYVSSAWVDVTAKSYQGGEWVDWFTYIVKNGIALIDFSGNLRSNNDTTITKENGYLQVVINNSRTAGPTTGKKIDITNIKTIYLDVDVKAIAKDYVSVGIFSALNSSTSDGILNNIVAEEATTKTGRQILMCDVENCSGEYYVGMFSNDNSENQAYTREYHIYNLYYS